MADLHPNPHLTYEFCDTGRPGSKKSDNWSGGKRNQTSNNVCILKNILTSQQPELNFAKMELAYFAGFKSRDVAKRKSVIETKFHENCHNTDLH